MGGDCIPKSDVVSYGAEDGSPSTLISVSYSVCDLYSVDGFQALIILSRNTRIVGTPNNPVLDGTRLNDAYLE